MIKDKNGYDFQEAEKQVKEQWKNNYYFEKLVKKNAHGERFRFLDGPITANNAMGIHHAFGRTLKDITIKYNSMKGKSCQFQNGFDAQGLWVEVEVEKQYGFKDKRDILNFGMEEFTNACLDRVQKYAGIISEQSKDLGQWMDWDDSYFTNSNENILGIWHFLKKCDEKGWLVKKHRVMSWCPRCGTSLSEHEMSGNYKLVTCQSVFFKLPLVHEDADLLVWTTTPWTLTSNAAVAVHPDLNYAFVKTKESERLIICCEDAVKRVVKGDLEEVVKVVKGSELLDLEYASLFKDFEVQNFKHRIIPWKDIVADEGTGLVHIAPGCGEEDFELGLLYDIPTICPINESGIIVDGFGNFSGQNTVNVASDIFKALEDNGNLYYVMDYEHKYANCWRCKTDIVYKLVDEWYIRSDEIRPQILEAVETVEWQPPHAKKRMVDWLNNMSDWNISRKRFYGLPLPFYVCEQCGKIHVIGSKEELIEKSSNKETINLERLHRPWIDKIKITCDCGAEVSRISEVGDCWLDAGIAPFVTKGYFKDKEYWRNNFPSEVVIEMIEQIRLWFYSMLFMSVTLEGCAPYEKVVSYGSVVREDGEKFSKSAGKDKNIVLGEAIDKMGADTIRYLYAGTTSVNDLRFGYSLGDDSKRKILAFWNTYTFFNIYASIDQPKIDKVSPELEELEPSDQWVIKLVDDFIELADKNYSKHMYSPILKSFEQLVDDINNWYIRINRKRFWKGEKSSKEVGYWVLYTAIKNICKVMAPIIPFMTDFIWHAMVRQFEVNESESVHLSDYPEMLMIVDDRDILSIVNDSREIISIVQKLRNEENLMIKQPLSEFVIVASDNYRNAVAIFSDEIKSETNVKEIYFADDTSSYVNSRLSVNFSKSGAVLKKDVNKFKDYLTSIDPEENDVILDQLKNKGEVTLDGFDMPLAKELFIVDFVPKSEFVISSKDSITIILKTTVTEALYKEFLIRTMIRKLQILRKDLNLHIENHIKLYVDSSNNEFTQILRDSEDEIKSELLIDQLYFETCIDNFIELTIDNYSLGIKIESI